MIAETKKLLLSGKYWYGLLILGVGALVNKLISSHMFKVYGKDLPTLKDNLFHILPYYNFRLYFDIMFVVAIGIFMVHTFKRTNEVPYILVLFGIINITRGIFIGLNPLNSPNMIDEGLFNSTLFRTGIFPSGHTGQSFLAYLLCNKPSTRSILLFMSVSIAFMLIIGRGHYSMDVFAAFLFAYAIYSFGEKHLKKRWVIDE